MRVLHSAQNEKSWEGVFDFYSIFQFQMLHRSPNLSEFSLEIFANQQALKSFYYLYSTWPMHSLILYYHQHQNCHHQLRYHHHQKNYKIYYFRGLKIWSRTWNFLMATRWKIRLTFSPDDTRMVLFKFLKILTSWLILSVKLFKNKNRKNLNFQYWAREQVFVAQSVSAFDC